MPKISIIIPTLNEEAFLDTTLSILEKGLLKTAHEIIVSDGRSGDKTVEIAKKYTDKVIVYNKEKRQTIAEAKNMGAAVAGGEYLLFMDADVQMADGDALLKVAFSEFEKDPKLGGITVSLKILPEEKKFGDNFFSGYVNLSHRLVNNVFHKGSASGEFQMVKREIFQKLGGFNEKIAVTEDMEFFSRLGNEYHTKMLSQLTVWHTGRRVHKIGWPKVLWQWFINHVSVKTRGEAFQKVWEPIR